MRLIKTRFTDMRTIRTLLEGAEAEAGRAGESTPGAEHLLLAALELPDGTARRAFERVGADPSALRQAIEEQHADALRAVGIDADAEPAVPVAPSTNGVYRSSGSAQSAFQAAGKLAREGRSRSPARTWCWRSPAWSTAPRYVPCAASGSTSTRSPLPAVKR